MMNPSQTALPASIDLDDLRTHYGPEVMTRIRSLVGACHRRMGRPLPEADVEEVVQETAILAWMRRNDAEEIDSVDSWLYGVARLSILERRRRTSRRLDRLPIEKAAGVADEGVTRPGSRIDTQFRGLVQEEIDGLGSTMGVILKSHLLDGEPFGRIAGQVDMNEAAVKSRYYRVLPRLRRRLVRLWSALESA